MKYMITMTDLEGSWDGLSSAEQDAVLRQHQEYKQALAEAGRFVEALHLHPRTEAMTVRMSADGGVDVEAGPYHRNREYMGSCYIITADSMDEAVEWARRGRFIEGANEVRQIWE